MALKNELPKIVETALKDEDKATRLLVNKLLSETMKTENEQRIKTTMFSEIEKCIDTGLIKE